MSFFSKGGKNVGVFLTSTIASGLVARSDSGDDFKRDFVVFDVSCLIKGYKSRIAHTSILFSLMDASGIGNMNWCAYTIDSLIEAVEEWKKKPSGSFCGPVLFFVLCYLDRVQFKLKGVVRSIPIIGCWDTQSVKLRAREEIKSGGLGKGRVLERLQRVVVDTISEKPMNEVRQHKDYVDRMTNVLGKMAGVMVEFGEVVAEIAKVQAPSDVLRKTFANFSKFFNNIPSSQSLQIQVEKDDVYNDPLFLKAVGEVEAVFYRTHDLFQGPSFDLGLNLSPIRTIPPRLATDMLNVPPKVLVDNVSVEAQNVGIVKTHNLTVASCCQPGGVTVESVGKVHDIAAHLSTLEKGKKAVLERETPISFIRQIVERNELVDSGLGGDDALKPLIGGEPPLRMGREGLKHSPTANLVGVGVLGENMKIVDR